MEGEGVKAHIVECRTKAGKRLFRIFVGKPAPGFHPLKYQAAWLQEMKGAALPRSFIEEFGLAGGEGEEAPPGRRDCRRKG